MQLPDRLYTARINTDGKAARQDYGQSERETGRAFTYAFSFNTFYFYIYFIYLYLTLLPKSKYFDITRKICLRIQIDEIRFRGRATAYKLFKIGFTHPQYKTSLLSNSFLEVLDFSRVSLLCLLPAFTVIDRPRSL